MSGKRHRRSDGRSSTDRAAGKAGIVGVLTTISAVVTLLGTIQLGLAQLFPSAIQKWFNGYVAELSDKYLSDDCDLSGSWRCVGGICKMPNDRAPTVSQDGDILHFTNELADSNPAAGFFVRHRLILVPSWDVRSGGAFAKVSNDCKRIEWLDSAV